MVALQLESQTEVQLTDFCSLILGLSIYLFILFFYLFLALTLSNVLGLPTMINMFVAVSSIYLHTFTLNLERNVNFYLLGSFS